MRNEKESREALERKKGGGGEMKEKERSQSEGE
jgi:hypothetical protein